MQATTSFYDTWYVGNNAREDSIKLHEFLIGKFRKAYMDMLNLDSFHKAENLGNFNMIS